MGVMLLLDFYVVTTQKKGMCDYECDDMMRELECGYLDIISTGLADTQRDPGHPVLLLTKPDDLRLKRGLW